MAKYIVGQKFRDIQDDSIYTIIAVAPDLDYEGEQSYFLQVDELIEGKWTKYFIGWEEKHLDNYTNLI